MRELSLHILDLIENSIRAGAAVISVSITESQELNFLRIVVEDNGPGLSVPPEMATDPFYTTKSGAPTGLGLSLFQAAAERAGGKLKLGTSNLGGLAVEVVMQLNHIDRSPLGDFAATISSVACTNPDIDIRCRISTDERERMMRISDVVERLPLHNLPIFETARAISEEIREASLSLHA
jgi:anti-sigma regulatory factor (Ser/Thr protein kinase)